MPHPHIHSPTYAPPVLRAPSPASSLGTSYAPDATSLSDSEAVLSHAAFEKKWEDRLRLGREFAREWNGDDADDDSDEGETMEWEAGRAQRDREKEGWGRDPLFPRVDGGGRTPAEDKFIHEQILRSLRYQIHQLQQNELFEGTLLTRGRGDPSQSTALSLEHQPTSNDIDTLMRGMMALGPGGGKGGHHRKGSVGSGDVTAGNTTAGTITSGPWNRGVDRCATPGPGKRSTAKGKGRSRRL